MDSSNSRQSKKLCFYRRSPQLYQAVAASGIIGPLLYDVFTIPMEAFGDNYSSIKQNISELGARGYPHHIIVDVLAFPILGLSLMLFTYALYEGLTQFHFFGEGKLLIRKVPNFDYKKWCLITGCTLFWVAGLMIVLTGFIFCETGCEHDTWRGKSHTIFAVISSTSLPCGALFLIPSFPKHGGWPKMQVMTILVIILMTACGLLQLGFYDYRGLFQRLASYLAQIWVVSMSIMLILTSQWQAELYHQLASTA